jgi:hypothetical protein
VSSKKFVNLFRNPGAKTIEDELERAINEAGGISEDNKGHLEKVKIIHSNWPLKRKDILDKIV